MTDDSSALEYETIKGQVIAKANHYQAVPGTMGTRRIIKDWQVRQYEEDFARQCTLYKDRLVSCKFKLFLRVFHSSIRYDLDNSLKTILDCLQAVRAIKDDKLCYSIVADKYIDKYNPRIEFAIKPSMVEARLFG